MNKKYDAGLREEALKLKEAGKSLRAISKLLDVPRSTLYYFFKDYKKKVYDQDMFNFERVLELLIQRKTNSEIVNILRPGTHIIHFYRWKDALPSEKKMLLKRKGKNYPIKEKKEVYVKKDFIVSNNLLLPVGV